MLNFSSNVRSVAVPLLVIFVATTMMAQPQGAAEGQSPAIAAPPANPDYALGPGDELIIWALGMEEISDKAFRVDATGHIDLPMIGRLKVAGGTLAEFRKLLLKAVAKYVMQPEVSAGVREFRSQPVTVLGAVNKPGILQLQGRKTLLEVVSMAENLRNDAGSKLNITRKREYGDLPLPGASVDNGEIYSMAEVLIRDLMGGRDPAANIVMQPHDVVSVSRASTVYVIGEVRKSGGFLLADRDRVSVLEAVSLAEGTTRLALPQKARILRVPEQRQGPRVDIPIDLQSMLAGKSPDVELKADDIIVIPDNKAKRALAKVLDAAVNVASGITVWRVGAIGQ